MPSIITIGVLAFASTALAHKSYTLHAYEGVDYFPTPISGGQPPLDTSPPLHPTGTFYYTPTGSGGYTPTGGPSSSSSSSVTAPYGNHTTTFSPSTTSSPPTTTPYLPPTPDVTLTTKTAYTTIVSTITSCPPVVTKCPVGNVVTKTIAVSTYICPVSEAGPTVTLVPIPESEYTQPPTPEYPSTNEPTYPDSPSTNEPTYPGSPSTEEPYTPPHVPATSTPVAPYPYPTSFTTLTGAPSGTAPVGSGTGAIHPTSPPYVPGTIEVTPITPPQSEQTTPPILEHTGAAGKMGVSSVLALVVVGVVALIF